MFRRRRTASFQDDIASLRRQLANLTARVDAAERIGPHVAALDTDLQRTREEQRWTASLVSRLAFPAASRREQPLDLQRADLAVRSQNGEDGILSLIVDALHGLHEHAVEIGCGEVVESTTAHLVVDRGWNGTFIDADSAACVAGQRWLRESRKTTTDQARVIESRVTIDNVNALLGSVGDMDVLSIDVDGNDYWLWNAVVASPAIVVVEYNASFGPDWSASIVYDEAFVWPARGQRNPSLDDCVYHGASLTALAALAAAKGYSLVATDARGVSAFFVQNSRLGDLRPCSPAEAWRPCAYRERLGSTEDQMSALRRRPTVDI